MTEIQFLHYEAEHAELLNKLSGLQKRQIAFCTDKHCFVYRTSNDEYKYFPYSKELQDAIATSNIETYLKRKSR